MRLGGESVFVEPWVLSVNSRKQLPKAHHYRGDTCPGMLGALEVPFLVSGLLFLITRSCFCLWS